MSTQYFESNSSLNINQLVGGLQKEDRRKERLTRIFQWVMVAYALFYFVGLVLWPSSDRLLIERLGGVCFVLGFLSFAYIFSLLYNEFRAVDYGVATVELLKNAVRRYSLFHTKSKFIILPILLIDAGMVMIRLDDQGIENLNREIINAQFLIIPSLLIGFTIGTLIWRKRQKPLRDAAIAMLKEFE